VVHQRETPLRRESPAFGEVQDDGSAVDAEADVFDGLVATIRRRCCLDSVRRGWSGIPIHGYIAGMVTPAALSGAKINTTHSASYLNFRPINYLSEDVVSRFTATFD
jgi:hypothetical protein